MSLFGALQAAVSGAKAGSLGMAVTSDNVAIANTYSAKKSKYFFDSLIRNSSGGTYNPGGVELSYKSTVDTQGSIESTSSSTDLAIEGDGMFVVNTKNDGSGAVRFTRQGDFSTDKYGNLVNSSGGYLMGWKLSGDTDEDNLMINSGTLSSLELVNINSIGSTPVKTSRIDLAMNLDASQNTLEGAGLNLKISSTKENNSLGMNDIIYPSSINTGHGITINYGDEISTTFTYGGFDESNVLDSDHKILGATDKDSKFSDMQDGDSFNIYTPATGTVTFSFASDNPDMTIGQFNNMKNLSSAINYVNGLSARISNNRLLVGASNATNETVFTNSTSSEPSSVTVNIATESIYGHGSAVTSKLSVDMASQSVFGVTSASGASATAFASGITSGDGIRISTDIGNEYVFTYKPTPTLSNEFNSLATLQTAINAVVGSDLSASLGGGDQLTVSASSTASAILSIEDVNDAGSSNIATTLGLVKDNKFNVSDGASVGDGIKIAVGSFASTSSDRINFATSQILGYHNSNIESVDISTASPYGVSAITAVFGHEATDGDGIRIETDTGTYTFTFKTTSPVAASGEFNSLDSLRAALNTNINFTSSISSSSLLARADGTNSERIFSISDLNTSGNSNFATKLGLIVKKPDADDTMTVKMDSGDEFTLTFTGPTGGSGSAGVPVTSLGEFYSVDTLIEALNDISDGKLSLTSSGGKIDVVAKKNDSIYSIDGSGTLNIAEYLGIDVSTLDLDFSFTGNSSGSGTSGAPDTSLGEFNSVNTLTQAIKSLSNGNLDVEFSEYGNKFSLVPKGGGVVKSVMNDNENGTSNFATRLGLRGVNITKALGLNNIDAEDDRFSSMQNLEDLILEKDGISSKVSNNVLKVYSDDPTKGIEFENSDSDSDFISFFNISKPELDAIYEPSSDGKNMASDNIDPHFTRRVSVIDSLGSEHDVEIGMIKLGSNKWGVEVFVPDKTEIRTNRNDGLLSYGTVTFDGSGKMISLDMVPVNPAPGDKIEIRWDNGADPSKVYIDLGKVLSSDDEINISKGIRQVDGNFEVNKLEQDGIGVGSASSIEIDEGGVVNVNLPGGIRSAYQLSIIKFANPNSLKLEGYNLYSPSIEAGSYSVKRANTDGAGAVESSALERSNVEIMDEMANMIMLQKGYQANAKAIQTANQMLEELNRIWG